MNAIMIEQVQSYPDTTITLVNGKKIVVQNTEEEVANLITTYYQKVFSHSMKSEVEEANE